MKIKPFNVVPYLPEKIVRVRDIALNYWFSWNSSAIQLFRHIDPETWEKCGRNPVKMLGLVSRSTLDNLAADSSFISRLEQTWESLNSYMNEPTWFQREYGETEEFTTAYFSMEFGLDAGLPVYSGGLGILAGDHLKSSSDLGIPLVGIGLLYHYGNFRQSLNTEGWQEETYLPNERHNLPITLERDNDGNPLLISVDQAGEILLAQIWRVMVGRIRLYLLDANLPENPPHLRGVTAQLYGGDRENRIRQEILLGIGGTRALTALGITPAVYHMNEGHSAFLALERLRTLMLSAGMSFKEAREVIWASNVFTTHTPIPEGNEVFDIQLVDKFFRKSLEHLGLSWDEFVSLGQIPGINQEHFSMTILAMNLAAQSNGVSRLHGQTSRTMWKAMWQGLPEHEIPVTHITNGVHTGTWMSQGLNDLITQHAGSKLSEDSRAGKSWKSIDDIPDEELWKLHQEQKERVIRLARDSHKRQLRKKGLYSGRTTASHELLSKNVLTVGFARRFAAYKRADLLVNNPERLIELINDSKHPVQFIIAGKAHPNDQTGKEIIRKLIRFTMQEEVNRSIVFLQDYDMEIAKQMVQGVDLWLSNSRIPLEASGTSGMKAVVNGVLNVGTLDGWWAEAYSPDCGWVIASDQMGDDSEAQDKIDAEMLYSLIENEIAPLFYKKDQKGLPVEWIRMMKRSIKAMGDFFSTQRMVREYFTEKYLPAGRAYQKLMYNNGETARRIAAWRGDVNQKWQMVNLRSDEVYPTEIKTAENLKIKARGNLNGINPDDVAVEVFFGQLDHLGNITDGKVVRLNQVGQDGNDTLFEGIIASDTGGQFGYTVRIMPYHPDLVHNLTPLLIKWEK